MLLAHDISKGDRTKDVKITQNITFETMLLAPETLKGLKDSGFHKPSPIQLYGIPIGKCGFDLLLEAKSGTGKTAVFSIIALEKIDCCKGLQVIILTPTREIAAQICDVLTQIGSSYKELKVAVVMGGLPVQDDIEKFKKPVHIVVGSPGRLRHLVQHKCIDIKSVRLFVFDEADKLMDSSFQLDIKYIYASLPKEKQVIMSSATYPKASREIISSYVQNASHICPDNDCILLGIDQKVTLVKYNNNIYRHIQDRFKELNKILSQLQFKQCLVFCNFQVRVAEVHKLLMKTDWPSEKLYGLQEQVDRLDALKTLQQYKCRILVSTDLAARGIDASNIDLVINFEPPNNWQTYLHRIGRAGRYGSYGLAITILSEGKEQQRFNEMFMSMELKINMRYLWSDKEYNICRTAPSTPSEISDLKSENLTATDLDEKASSKDMWELLSSKNNTISTIETFETLIKSIDQYDIPNIETFSDLMISLKDNNYKDTEQDVVFKHIEMKKISTHGSILPLNSQTEKYTVIKDLKVNGNENIDYNMNEKREESKQKSLDDSVIINGNVNHTDEDESNHWRESNKGFLDLDLPISFSSTKLKLHDSKHKNNNMKTNNEPYNSNIYKSNDLNVNYIKPKSQENPYLFEVNGNTGSPNTRFKREAHYRNRIKVDHCDRANNYYEKDNRFDLTSDFVNLPNPVNIRKFTSEGRLKQENHAKLYSNWYNQLKMRMKYIEHAIYIDVMSKF